MVCRNFYFKDCGHNMIFCNLATADRRCLIPFPFSRCHNGQHNYRPTLELLPMEGDSEIHLPTKLCIYSLLYLKYSRVNIGFVVWIYKEPFQQIDIPVIDCGVLLLGNIHHQLPALYQILTGHHSVLSYESIKKYLQKLDIPVIDSSILLWTDLDFS